MYRRGVMSPIQGYQVTSGIVPVVLRVHVVDYYHYMYIYINTEISHNKSYQFIIISGIYWVIALSTNLYYVQITCHAFPHDHR